MSLPSRRLFLRSAAVAGLAGGAVVGQPAAPPQGDPAADWITPEAQAAIDRGLAFLANAQVSDGSFSDTRTGFGNVAITGLAGLALMSGGHQPGRGQFGKCVARAADYVAARGAANSPRGYLNNTDATVSHAGMYQHGFGALFLAEVHGMLADADRRKRVRQALEDAVALTRKSQNRDGGWRYDPAPVNADVSVTVAQLMALRAAKNAGLFIPKAAIDKCVEYILACQMPDGGFCYIKGQGFAGSAFARSAAAVVGLFSAGVYDGKPIEKGLAYLLRFLPGRRANFAEARPEHYYYGQYYAALAMWTAGGAFWADWFPAVREELLQKANTTPGRLWSDYHGTAYATAMALIVLQLPNNYLPIMQK